jgi:hypothetical protein
MKRSGVPVSQVRRCTRSWTRLIAGGNVTEGVVRKVFSQSLHLVVHLDRDDIPPNDTDGIPRQIMQIVASFRR